MNLDAYAHTVEREVEAMQEKASFLISNAVKRELQRIKGAHLQKRKLGFLDAMGVICIHVDGVSIDDIAYRRNPPPKWLHDLHKLRDWYAKVADLANITIEDTHA